MVWEQLALSRSDDFLFQLCLIPAGLVIAWNGSRAIQSRTFYPLRRMKPLQGKSAQIAGVTVIVLGLSFSILATVQVLRQLLQ